MSDPYKVLASKLLPMGTRVADGNHGQHSIVAYSDPAVSVMTNFKQTRPFTIEPSATIDQINDKMIACGVRLLFVVDNYMNVMGIVTYTDILGEKPIRYMQEHGGNRNDILAKDLMTEYNRIDTLKLSHVENACVGDIVETMEMFARHHIVVVDDSTESGKVVSGLYSTTQIERQTGIEIELSASASTFADLEMALGA